MSRFAIKKPGVYIEELRNTPKPIEGINTSIVAFIGETQTGPTTPTVITSWNQFKSVFGSYFGIDKFLPYAVEGFFVNGGQKCYISRVTTGNYESALAELEAIKDISTLYVPNAQLIHGLPDAIIDQCERLRNRIAIFDTLKGQAPSNITKPRESTYAALYYPWICIKPEGTNQTVLVPPGGHIAGIYVRSDTQRGIHKAPTNEPIQGAIKLDITITEAQQSSLNSQGINCIRNFEGRGILVWGARTLSTNPEYKYINVRRLIIYFQESIEVGTTWAIFEPNTEATWAKVKSQVENFLMQNWKNGMLTGIKPADAYFVRCDRTTMTQNDIDNNQLIVQIGVAITRPAEFMSLHVSHTSAQ